MNKTAKIEIEGKTYELPIVEGTEGEKAVDISALRAQSGYITLDDGYGNTGSCQSSVTFIDGEKGVLRYRGIPIEELALKSTFVETAFLIVYGHLPNRDELRRFSGLLTKNENIHEDMKFHFEGFPSNAHPMAILSSMINASSCFYPELMRGVRREDLRNPGGAPALASAHHRGLLVPEVPRTPHHLPEAGLQVHGQLPAHDVLGSLRGLPVAARGGSRPGPDLPVARGSRAKLLDRHGPLHRLQPGQPLCQRRRRASARFGGRCTAERTRRSSRCLRTSGPRATTGGGSSTP